MTIKSTVYNVRDFGAKGDGVTDDSDAFAAAIKAVWDNYTQLTYVEAGGDGSRRPNAKIYIPAGSYIITKPESMMPSRYSSTPFVGLVFEGDGRYATFIFFKPTSPAYLLSNNNSFLHLTFRDMAFVSNTTNASWMSSFSNGTAQNYAFDRVIWGGTWNYGIVLTGIDTNSEMSWQHCNVNGTWTTFFYVPQNASTSGTPTNADQFVNYNFYSCNMEISGGSMIDLAYGGSVGIWGGSYMYYSGTTTGGTMINLRNDNHGQGACRIFISGIRVELPSTVCKFLYCEWPDGTVTLVNVDLAVQSWNTVAGIQNVNNVTFNFGNVSGPEIQFIGCMFQGKHEYKYAINPGLRSPRILYQNCVIVNYREAKDFVVLTTLQDPYQGGRPNIKFDMCRGLQDADQGKYVFDTTLNWDYAPTGLAQKRVLKMANLFNGGLPDLSGNVEAYLPMGAIVTRVVLYAKPGANSGTGTWNFELKTSETTPTSLATATPDGGAPTNGFSVVKDMVFLCDSDAKRHLILTGDMTAYSYPKGYCLVEYIC